ncbi:alkaline phosphatase [Membranihabitans marinus]
MAGAGATLFSSTIGKAQNVDFTGKGKKAKNVIMFISDGMSTGTLNMMDLFKLRQYGSGSNWLQLYRENRVSRALMDTASANSIVTDSAAASSSFGGGQRVKNGSLNISPDGKPNLPILQKFKKSGKKTGCVTSVTITHATPAGFCITQDNRGDQAAIAEKYLEGKFDVLMGGGDQYFNPELRKDKKDLYSEFQKVGYQIAKTRKELLSLKGNSPVLGIFSDGALPYSIDRKSSKELTEKTPTLAEMTSKAIDVLKDHPEGFVLQVEGGKVDWAAHANDIAGLLYDQFAFDDAIKVALDFAEKNEDTLLIMTTDHGNANPGTISGSSANDQFDSIANYTQTNEWLLNQISSESSLNEIKDLIFRANGIELSQEEVEHIYSYYHGLNKESGLYNYKKLPFETYAKMQKSRNSVGWISMSHSGDYVELAMYGPGSEYLEPYMLNTDIHYLMLQATEVENRF